MILIVDDDRSILLSLKLMLTRKGYEVTTVASPAEAMDVVRSTAPELILMDMNFSYSTSGDEGLTLLRQVKVFRPDTPVILMTAWGSIPLAVKGIQMGAFDFITKPWDNAMLLSTIDTAISLSSKTGQDDSAEFDSGALIGRSPGLMAVLDTVRRVARTDAPVLIMGENGTGKELVAEALHRNSRRRGRPFVKVNLGGISQSLFESEMFGHKKGAFTGATADRTGRFGMADGGTIFLDEIGDLDASCQVKLLRVLQEHTYEVLGDSRPRKTDIRVVCATNADLPSMVADGRFREDLFYRINLITVTLPPLRERRDDIPLLVEHFARSVADGKTTVTPDAMRFLVSLPYPGNIRELKNLVERTILVGSGSGVLDADCFRAQYHGGVAAQAPADADTQALTLGQMERRAIEATLRKYDGNLTKAAVALGITRQALYRRMEKYGITS